MGELEIGSRFAGYQVEGVLGRGGMGTVLRARDLKLQRPVALKVIASAVAKDPAYRERFRREALAASAIEHPHVVPVYQAGQHEGSLFLVTRLIEGDDLRAVIAREGPLPAERAVRLVTHVAFALDAAHRRGLVHRDVKPANILIADEPDGEHAYLTDFGIAARIRAEERLTQTGSVVGTLDYIAPEALRGDRCEASADVYALGCVLFEALAGRAPFAHLSDVAQLSAILFEPPPSLCERRPDVPGALDEAIRKALAKQPRDRYASAGELARAAAGALRPGAAHDTPGRPAAESGPRRLAERATGVPHPGTRLIGREEDVRHVLALLAGQEARLVTLTGTGGVGKTRLAVEIAARLVDARLAEVVFVELASTPDASLIRSQIATALGVSDDAVVEALRDRPAVLVLDNLEHLAGADREVASLLAGFPSARVLATSRAPLRLRQEHELRVAPLPVETSGGTAPAVQLFVERARSAVHRFTATDAELEAVTAVCARLDGLPLAIELAAARIRALPPEALLRRMEKRLDVLNRGPRDLPDRHRTLEAAIAWSHELLSEPERAVFARVAVFPGSWTLEAAEAVCPDAGEIELLDHVQSLVESSLLVGPIAAADEAPRFAMLQTVREFALARLEDSGHARATHKRMAEFHRALTDGAIAGVHGPQQSVWVAKLDAELANLRASIGWAQASGESALVLCLSASLSTYMTLRGAAREPRAWLEDALATAAEPSPERTRALIHLCVLTSMHGDAPATAPRADELERLLPGIRDRTLRKWALMTLGMAAAMLQRYDVAASRFLESAELARADGDDQFLASVLGNLGDLYMRERRLHAALEVLRESVHLARRVGDRHQEAAQVSNIATVQLALGDVEASKRDFAWCFERAEALGDEFVVLFAVEGLGWCAAREGRVDEAARLLASAEARREEAGHEITGLEAELQQRAVEEVQRRLGGERLRRLWQEGRRLSLQDAAASALGTAELTIVDAGV